MFFLLYFVLYLFLIRCNATQEWKKNDKLQDKTMSSTSHCLYVYVVQIKTDWFHVIQCYSKKKGCVDALIAHGRRMMVSSLMFHNLVRKHTLNNKKKTLIDWSLTHFPGHFFIKIMTILLLKNKKKLIKTSLHKKKIIIFDYTSNEKNFNSVVIPTFIIIIWYVNWMMEWRLITSFYYYDYMTIENYYINITWH